MAAVDGLYRSVRKVIEEDRKVKSHSSGNGYQPPYTVSDQAVSLIAEIAAALEHYRIAMEGPDGLRLRRVNHIRTIRGTTAIEGNTLTEEQITAVLSGKRVSASRREVAEIKGAHTAYGLIEKIDPCSAKDLLRVHAVMMKGLVDGAGAFRSRGVGVVDGSGNVLHMAPPAARVHALVGDLLAWARESAAHPLVKSCVFHYEFEFIHPFLDGNGRMGRFLQTALLGRWNPLFYAAPVENIVFANQAGYYEAINASTEKADCGPFIDFMLGRILETIHEKGIRSDDPINDPINDPIKVALMKIVSSEPGLNREGLASRIGKSVETVKRALAPLIAMGRIEHRGSKKTGGYFPVASAHKATK